MPFCVDTHLLLGWAKNCALTKGRIPVILDYRIIREALHYDPVVRKPQGGNLYGFDRRFVNYEKKADFVAGSGHGGHVHRRRFGHRGRSRAH